MTEDEDGGAAGESPDSETDDAGEQAEPEDQGEGASAEDPEAVSPAVHDDRFAATIRLRGELGKPSMTGEGSADELTVKIKVAGADLSDLHHSLRPYAGRTVEAVVLPLSTAEERLPWETPPHPDQTRLPLDEQSEEAAGGLVCAQCGASYEISVDDTCPECGGALRPRDDAAVSEDAAGEGGAEAHDAEPVESGSAE